MNFSRLALFTVTALISSGFAQASTYNYAFGGLGSLNSNTYTFSPTGSSGPSIVATGYTGLGGSLSSVNLYSKGQAGFPVSNDESGLGLVNDTSGDHEITSGSFIMLDLGQLTGISSFNLYTESTTNGEQFKVWGSQTTPSMTSSYAVPSTNVVSGNTEGVQNISSLNGDRYLFITATNGNVLLGGFTATTAAVPEPATVGLMGMALIGAALISRRRLAKQVN